MGEPSQASLNLTAEEKRTFGQLFTQADQDQLGVVTGDVAVKFFEKTRLDSSVLGEIWQIGDSENRGFLTRAGFSIVLRLIGYAQNGTNPSAALAMKPGPLPRFDGATPGSQRAGPPPPAQNIPQQTTGTAAGPVRVPPLPAEKIQEYTNLFERAGGRNGFLGGDQARSVFEESNLSNEVLGQVWNLTDREQRGALNTTEFVVALHLLASMRNGAMSSLPQTLPQGLYDAAARKPAPPAATNVPRQLTGQQQRSQRGSPAVGRQYGTPPMSAQTTGTDWLVSPQDKVQFDRSFANLDKSNQGFITGEQAVTFFSNSGLSEDALAQVWDLSDINSSGQLSRDEFAVAMYLIRQQRGKRDERDNLPTTLPAQLIPPSMRQQQQSSQTTAPTFDNAANATPQTKSAADDLFGLDALAEEPSSPQQRQQQQQQPPAQPQQQQATGSKTVSFNDQPTMSPSSPVKTQTTGFGAASSFKPFQPTSSFGQGLTSQTTGGSFQSSGSRDQGAPQQQARGNDDLLGDDDHQTSGQIGNDTTELANMSNQIGILRNQMQDVQTKKSTNEREVSAQATQKKELQERLTQFRQQYEAEIREVKSLEDQLNKSKSDTQRLQSDLAMIEGTHADLKTQHQQLSTALEADRQENASLKEKVQALNAEINELKPQLEKLRADSRQQRGMVAINKKQVSTSEGERDKIKTEMGDHEKAAAERAASPEISRGVSTPPVTSPPVTSPGGSKNPFFRAKSPQQSVDSAMSGSAFSQPQQDPSANFDSVFGPRASQNDARGPPSTSFRNDDSQSVNRSQTSTPPAITAMSPQHTRQETPSQIEPPPPPESRQITSSALPLQTSKLRSDSFGSSVKAMPPASRGGLSDTTTPTQSIQGDELAQGTPTRTQAPTAGSLLAPSTTTANRSASPLQSQATGESLYEPAPETNPALPGSFPGDSTSRIASPAPGTIDKGKGKAVSPDDADDTDDPFSSNVAPKRPDGAPVTNGMPTAFAGAGLGGVPAKRSNPEFPPIQDVEPEESDTSSEGGFDDSFAPTAPIGSGATAAAPSQHTDTLPVPETTTATMTSAPSSGLPTPSREKSPPTYNEAQPESEHRDSNQFPPQFTGLLAKRESVDDNIPHEHRSGSLTENFSPPGSSLRDVFPSKPHPEDPVSETSNIKQAPTLGSPAPISEKPLPSDPPKPQTTVAPPVAERDEFDDAFNDLSESKAEDDVDSSFNPSASSHNFSASTASIPTSGHRPNYEFDPVFDSPAPSKGSLYAESQATPTGSAQHTANNSFNISSSTAGNASSTTTRTAGHAPQQSVDQFAGSSQPNDWDAIFSGLDTAPAIAHDGKSPFDLGGPGESTSAFPEDEPPSAGIGSSGGRAGLATPTRPSVGRGVSSGTEHDDPILQSLTSMGFPRGKALKALERYDYNLDAAADWLSRNS